TSERSCAEGRSPLRPAGRVMARAPREPLATAAAYDGQARVSLQLALSRTEPPGRDLAVAVDELHVLHRRIQTQQPLDARVASAGGREGTLRIQRYDLGAGSRRPLRAPIGRSGVDVDDRGTARRE